MRVLVRNDKTRRYFCEVGAWVTEANEAMCFPTLYAAGKKAREIEDCDVVLSYENPSCELALNPVYCVQPGSTSQRLFS
jgi:hypothetical protein